MQTLFQDLRLGFRTLLKTPAFTAVVVLTLALGIGANVALFSVVNGVLLNPLPFPHPEQLVLLDQSKPNFETGAIPYPNFRDLQKENQTFSAMAISRRFSFSLIGSGEAEQVSARLVSADFFTVLGVQAARGRTFAAGEDESGVPPVAVISANLWQRKFNAAEDIVGKAVTLDEKNYTVIGVTPADLALYRTTEVFVPIGQWNTPALKNRGAALGLHGIGRLKPGVTVEQGQADLNRIMNNLAISYPETNRGNSSKVSPLKERIVGEIRPVLLLLLGSVGFVLLIACVNVSNLLLARSTSRMREFAVRSALGASRWRLLRQSLTESTLLACGGGVLGLLVAAWGTHAALAVLPTSLPRAAEVRMEPLVLIFAFVISVLTGILSGLAPALKTAGRSLADTLKEGGRSASGRGRAQGLLVAVEMALALVLLIGAGLMIRSLAALWNVDPGFRSDNVLTFGLSFSPSLRSAEPQAIRATLRDLSDQIAATPGVKAASFTFGAVPILSEDDLYFWLADQPKPASQSEMKEALIYRVEPGYLQAMSIPLKQGRFFTNQDDERSQPVAVIDEVLAQKYFGDTNPLGKHIQHDDDQRPLEIVGVVGHVKQWGLDSDDTESLRSQLYKPFRQASNRSVQNAAAGVGVVVLTDGPGPNLLDSLRQLIHSRSNQNVISQPQTMNEVIAESLAARRFSMILLDAFAVVALLLASLGLYGVISYLVGQRTHELGIRVALGAQRRDILRLVLQNGMKMALTGVGLGLVSALALTRLLAKMVYGISTTDPLTFALITLLLTAVALLACLVPARRATKVDPLVALRYE
jgi:predicted permease